MTEAAKRCVFKALAMGEEDVVRRLDLSFFDWRSTHNDFGTPLHAILFGKISYESADDEEVDKEVEEKYRVHEFTDIVSADEANRKARLELVRFAIQNGADPHAVAPKECNASRLWGDDSNMKRVEFASESALECLLATKRFIRTIDELRDEDDAEWTEELATVEEALRIIASASRGTSTASVPEGVATTWDNVLADVDTMDVTLRARCGGGSSASASTAGADGGAEEATVAELRAHRAVLRGASPVLRAMLSMQSTMKEGATQVIDVEDCTLEGLRLLVGLIYTGTVDSSADATPTVPTILCALDLAHRWQVNHLVPMLAAGAGRRLDENCLEGAMCAALRLQLPGLLTACRNYATDHKQKMRTRLNKKGEGGFRSAEVRKEIERVLGGSAPSSQAADAAPKRRRMAL
eukprot:TRINITY_DN37901_c0_g1_i1.p1 TRINITY_DN37901_c0_g1~~TRINITY_DN37901_c0_g1_i1.p1  ORF type:complete len:430 (-),score=99.22 TRINITY_DN37901_c0_g1_i1:63-1289(-)